MKPRIHIAIMGCATAFAGVEHRLRELGNDATIVHINDVQEIKKSNLQTFEQIQPIEYKRFDLKAMEIIDNPLLFNNKSFIEGKKLPRRKKY